MIRPEVAGVRHRFVQLDDLKMHLAEAGDPSKPLVILLHGFPEFWYSWRHQLRALADIAHVVAPDGRGYGETDKPKTGYKIEQLAADMRDLIALLGAERGDDKQQAIFVAHDWGGPIAFALAALYPERVAKLCVLNGPHSVAYARTVAHSFSQIRKSWYILMFQVPGLFESAFFKDPKTMMAKMFHGAAVNRSVFPPEETDIYAEVMAQPGALKAALAYYRNALGTAWRLKPLSAPLAMPVLVLWGRQDPALEAALVDAARPFCTGSFEVQWFDGSGHWLQQEMAAEVNQSLREFITK